MKIVQFNENKLAECAAFWWSIYKDKMYFHRRDGYQATNTSPVNPQSFIKHRNLLFTDLSRKSVTQSGNKFWPHRKKEAAIR